MKGHGNYLYQTFNYCRSNKTIRVRSILIKNKICESIQQTLPVQGEHQNALEKDAKYVQS